MFTFEQIAKTIPPYLAHDRFIDAYRCNAEHVEFQSLASEVYALFPFRQHPSMPVGALELATKAGVINVTAAYREATTPLPLTVFMVAHNTQHEPTCIGAIQGIQHYPQPFVGYIETLEGFRRQGHAKRMLGYMSLLSHTIYDQSITSGPESYLSADGLALAIATADRYNLRIEDSQVIGI